MWVRLARYHLDSVTWFLPEIRKKRSDSGCCIATRSYLPSQVRFFAALVAEAFRLRIRGVIG